MKKCIGTILLVVRWRHENAGRCLLGEGQPRVGVGVYRGEQQEMVEIPTSAPSFVELNILLKFARCMNSGTKSAMGN